MSENLVACEFEDSTNCVWNAQEQGNGIGESFVDINGTAHYVEDVSEVIDIEYEDGFFVDCETQMLHYWYVGSEGHDIVDEGTPASGSELYNYGCTDEAGNVVWPIPEEVGEVIASPELPEPVEDLIIETPVIVDPVPEELANTGTGDVVVGVLVGLALLAAGVVLFIRGRKNK